MEKEWIEEFMEDVKSKIVTDDLADNMIAMKELILEARKKQ